MARLRAMADPRAAASAARFGIQGEGILGIPTPRLRALAREIGRDHRLAEQLWDTGSNSARHLAVMIDRPEWVTETQMEAWVRDFNSWDVCDGACWNFFDRTPFAWKKAVAWTRRRPEYERRAGFVLIAGLALHEKEAPDRAFLRFLPIIERGADDDRNFVKKAVNWALREIGKRSRPLNRAAVRSAQTIRRRGSAAARWIAADALRELSSPAVQRRLPR